MVDCLLIVYKTKVYFAFFCTLSPCYHPVLLEELQMAMALIEGMGPIPIPSSSLRGGHGHELVESSGQRSQS